MYATNCEFDGIKLSDYGMMICTIDSSSGVETVSSGADITFNTIKPTGSNRFKYIDAKYEEAYTTTFQICKIPNDLKEDLYLTANEVSGLQRWLCRKDGFHRFSVIQDDLKDTFWNATFSSKAILINGQIAGLELTMFTDAPYAYLNIGTISYSPTCGENFRLYDMSDEIGTIYPFVTITCNDDGVIKITNDMEINEKRYTELKVKKGEVITLDGENKIINSNKAILDEKRYEELISSFNFNFPRITNTYNNRENIYTLLSDDNPNFSCIITFSYNPIVKVGL